MSYFVLVFFIFFNVVWSYQSSKTVDDKDLKWNYPLIPIKIENTSHSLSNSSQIIQDSIAEWNLASTFQIVSNPNANSSIKFSDNFSIYGSAVIGVTEVSYGTTGVINKATILLNEEHYDFRASPGMSFGSSVYLKDVVTHEFGHFLGLGHTEVLDATMFYAHFPGQADLSADDFAGIRQKYGTGYGKIFGHVQGGNKVGVLGVHVQLISRSEGKVISGITDEDGYFEIGGLNLNDSYFLYTSPLKKTEAIASHYSNVQSEFCPARYVGSFYSPCGRESDGLPQGIHLSSGRPEADVGVVTINCALRAQEEYTFEKLQPDFHPITLLDYANEPRFEKSYVGFFRADELSVNTFSSEDIFIVDLTSIELPATKSLEIKLVSQPLGNPIQFEMEINQNGNPISGSPFQMTTLSPEGILKLDLAAIKNLSSSQPQNLFEIKIKAKKLSYNYAFDDAAFAIPDFDNFGARSHYPYLLIVSLKEGSNHLVDTGSVLSDNASCLEAPFTYSAQKSVDHSADTSSVDNSDVAVAAACATLGPHDGSGPGSGPSGFMMLLSIGFMLSLIILSFAKRAKNFLS